MEDDGAAIIRTSREHQQSDGDEGERDDGVHDARENHRGRTHRRGEPNTVFALGAITGHAVDDDVSRANAAIDLPEAIDVLQIDAVDLEQDIALTEPRLIRGPTGINHDHAARFHAPDAAGRKIGLQIADAGPSELVPLLN